MKTLNLIADGDSWASYPKFLLTGGGLVDHLAAVLGLPITNYAHPGDSTVETMGLVKSRRLESILPGADVLIFSGGGDDLAGDAFCEVLNQNDGTDNFAKAINWPRLNARLESIIASYEDLADLRDLHAPNCLIVTHSYDFPPASKMGVGVLDLKGPWLQPGLEYCGWKEPVLQAPTVKMILQRFDVVMRDWANRTKNVLHCTLQGTLSEGDWQNEMHANGQGWPKLAQVMNAALLPWLDRLAAPPASLAQEAETADYHTAD